MSSKFDQEKHNPCLKEQQMVYKCLDGNYYDSTPCKNHILNYRNCKDFWVKVQSDRRKKGVRPLLPPVAERERIKEEYLQERVASKS